MFSFKKLFNWLNSYSISTEELLRVLRGFDNPSLLLLVVEEDNIGYINNVAYDGNANVLLIEVKFADNVECLFCSRVSVLELEELLKNHLSANIKIQGKDAMYRLDKYANSYLNRADKKTYCNWLRLEKI